MEAKILADSSTFHSSLEIGVIGGSSTRRWSEKCGAMKRGES